MVIVGAATLTERPVLSLIILREGRIITLMTDCGLQCVMLLERPIIWCVQFIMMGSIIHLYGA